jgi:uncharacterized protein (TIGR02266 family)
MAGERRKDRRVPIDLWIEAEEGEDLYLQRAANLSVGGAYFAQTVPQKLGTQVHLKFSLPGDEREIRCSGEIVSAPEKGLGMGVRFLDLAEADRVRIEALIQQLAKA